nr:unnamed protein product [Digitaria exilis]
MRLEIRRPLLLVFLLVSSRQRREGGARRRRRPVAVAASCSAPPPPPRPEALKPRATRREGLRSSVDRGDEIRGGERGGTRFVTPSPRLLTAPEPRKSREIGGRGIPRRFAKAPKW